MILTAEQLEQALFALDGVTMDELGAQLRERARHRRRPITEDEARAAVICAPLTDTWEQSRFADVGRVRTACRLLIERGWHPEQVIPAMSTIGAEAIGHEAVAAEAVRGGIADALELREPADGG